MPKIIRLPGKLRLFRQFFVRISDCSAMMAVLWKDSWTDLFCRAKKGAPQAVSPGRQKPQHKLSQCSACRRAQDLEAFRLNMYDAGCLWLFEEGTQRSSRSDAPDIAGGPCTFQPARRLPHGRWKKGRRQLPGSISQPVSAYIRCHRVQSG